MSETETDKNGEIKFFGKPKNKEIKQILWRLSYQI